MKLYILTGESSGDIHAANLVRELKLYNSSVKIRAWGGERLIAEGVDLASNITSAALNRDLEKILLWSKKWKYTFNPKKSKDMISSNKNLNNSPPTLLVNTFIDRVNSHIKASRYLSC